MATSEIGKGGAGRSAGLGDLFLNEGKQITRMKSIPNLVPESVDADVFEGASFAEGVNPVTKNALGGMGEYPQIPVMRIFKR